VGENVRSLASENEATSYIVVPRLVSFRHRSTFSLLCYVPLFLDNHNFVLFVLRPSLKILAVCKFGLLPRYGELPGFQAILGEVGAVEFVDKVYFLLTAIPATTTTVVGEES